MDFMRNLKPCYGNIGIRRKIVTIRLHQFLLRTKNSNRKYQVFIFNKEKIYEAIWYNEYIYDERNMTAYINKIRRKMEQTCQELGMNMITAVTIFAKKMTREKRIPFEVSVDPFYSESNMAHLRRGVEALNAGKGMEHDIIEVDE